MRYQRELTAAITAVKLAAKVCRDVQLDLVNAETLQKKDKSPVTVADFASQAIVGAVLAEHFPQDVLVGEEDSKGLLDESLTPLRQAIVRHVNQALNQQNPEAQVLDWIDRGMDAGNGSRHWTLDPIDGTKGFLRGEHYAVALALIVGGEVVLGVLGCPNMETQGEQGALFYAIKGKGAFSQPLFSEGEVQAISTANVETTNDARFCESVESGHSDHELSAKIAADLGIVSEPFRIDSQCKYAAVARNDASIYLRLPTRADYQEKIWDHAAGKLIVEAAGGTVTDIYGKPLDFSHGRTLSDNKGVIATSGQIHDQVVAAVQRTMTN